MGTRLAVRCVACDLAAGEGTAGMARSTPCFSLALLSERPIVPEWEELGEDSRAKEGVPKKGAEEREDEDEDDASWSGSTEWSRDRSTCACRRPASAVHTRTRNTHKETRAWGLRVAHTFWGTSLHTRAHASE